MGRKMVTQFLVNTRGNVNWKNKENTNVEWKLWWSSVTIR